MNADQSSSTRIATNLVTRGIVTILVIAISIVSTSTSMAQDKTELGERQRTVQRKMVELENKFTIIAERMMAKEPERAKRLIDAYQQAKEMLITKKMTEISQLLDENKLVEADKALDEVILSLDGLVRLLMNQKDKELSKRDEIEQLERWKKTIKKLQSEQNQQTRDTHKVANKDKTLNKLDAQIKKLENLIGRQENVVENTKQSKGAGIRALDKVADDQFQIRKETESLEKELGEDPTSKIGDQKPGDQKPGDQKPGDSKPGDQKPGDSKPGDSKPGDSKPGDSKPGDSKPGDSKPGDSKPGDSKPGDSKPGDQKSQQQPQPGQQPLQQAAKNQQKAEEKLGSGKSEDAKRQAEKALTEMENAKKELKKERDRIASLPPEAFDEMAEKQRRTKDKALDVAEEMAKAPKPKPDQAGDQNANADQKKQPGQQQMQDASQSMQKAAKDLGEQDPKQAERNQKQAEKKLEEALEDIEERLNQLREETREEKLARLEARFREMLERQQVASVMTIELDEKKVNLGRMRRRDQLMMLRLGTEESEISELCQQAYDLLLEDGTSIAFPEIVQGLREDLDSVSILLQQEKTGQLTQLLQKEIETTLEELLDALAQTKKNRKGGGGGGGGGGGKQPLLQRSAELKIMKAAQRRIHRRTKGVDRIREAGETEKGMEADLIKELQDLAGRQLELQEMAERIMEEDGG